MAALGTYQTTLFAQGEPAVVAGAAVQRLHLDELCWVDLARNWLGGADAVLARLATTLEWRRGRRPMYGELVDEPRLHARLDGADPSTPRVVSEMLSWLEARYGEGIGPAWINYYRDGHDSVAWHADRVGLHEVDPIVAICSLGGPRRFLMRAMDRPGPTRRFLLGSGDLLVMGGACQHAWEHSVPKMASAPPRMSVTFRHVADGPDDSWWYAPVPASA